VDAQPKAPCQLAPSQWDIANITDQISKALIRARVSDALKGCSTCPALAWCRSSARQNPPQHPCVQGGLIWSGKASRPTRYRDWNPTRVPHPAADTSADLVAAA
jgi:hypothetical protein